MSDPEVLLEFRDSVAVITLNAPQRRNAMTPQMASDFCDLLEEVDRRTDVGALVVRGDEKAFCSGADLSVLGDAAADPLDAKNFDAFGQVYQAFYALGHVCVPTIAAARGWSVGAGLNLLLATDLRIMADDARIRSGFQQRGLHPGGGHFHLLSRVAGREAAAALGLFAADIDGLRAVQLGLAWAAVPSAEVEDMAFEFAARVAGTPALARRLTASFREESEGSGMNWRTAVEYERTSQMWSMRQPK